MYQEKIDRTTIDETKTDAAKSGETNADGTEYDRTSSAGCDKRFECCADMIGLKDGKLVIIERLSEPKGFALPGGRLENNETLEQCAVREYEEETGLKFKSIRQFGTYSDPKRDVRGRKISTVFIGETAGDIHDEESKTKVLLMDISDIEENKERFVFDHYVIIMNWLKESAGKRL